MFVQNFKRLGSLAYVLTQTIKGKSRYARLAIDPLHFIFPRHLHDGLYDLLTMRPACKRMTDAKETWTCQVQDSRIHTAVENAQR